MSAVVGAGAMQSFVQHVSHQRLIVDYAYVTAIAALIYDYLLTVHLEIRLVWFSPWNYTKILFLMTRYIPLINTYFLLQNQLVSDVDTDVCKRSVNVGTWLLMAVIILSEVIFLIRSWAVWHRDWRVGIFATVMWAGFAAGALVKTVQYLDSLKYMPLPYRGFRGCPISGFNKSFLEQYLLLAVLDAVVLIFMVISAFQAYKSGDNGELSNVIHKDAILFYFYLLICSSASSVIIYTASSDLMITLCPLQTGLHSIFASRILFNIRNVARRRTSAGTTIDLHSRYQEMDADVEFEDVEPPQDIFPDDIDLSSPVRAGTRHPEDGTPG